MHTSFNTAQKLSPFMIYLQQYFVSIKLAYLDPNMSRPARKPTFWTLRKNIDPDQSKHATKAYPDRHFSPPVDFLFRESLLYTSIP